MNDDSSADYVTLKKALLGMWVPVIGAQNASHLWIRNFNKFCSDYLNINDMYSLIQNWCTRNKQDNFNIFYFEPSFERYFDAQPPFQLDQAILTGSLSEGLFLYAKEPPDMDFMCVLKNITFSHEDQRNGGLLLREDTPFVYAFLTNEKVQEIWRDFCEGETDEPKKRRLSSRKLKEKLQEKYQKTENVFSSIFGKEKSDEVAEGAAMTITKANQFTYIDCLASFFAKILNHPIFKPFDAHKEYWESIAGLPDLMYTRLIQSSDIVLAISCEGWPSCAQAWIKRERYWPDKKVVENVARGGYHIIPKSSPDGDFRLSFSCSEVILIETLSQLQHKVMRAFKSVVKYYQNTWDSNLKDFISSYHLKTIAFWHFERSCRDSWTEDTVVNHLVKLLEELSEVLRTQRLPKYFMDNVNLLKDIDDPEIALALMENILQLSRDLPALSEALNSRMSLKEMIGSDYDKAHNFLDTIHKVSLENIKKDGKTSFTWYDLIDNVRAAFSNDL